MYNIIAIAGKAGSGKDTILHEVLAAAPDRFHEIVSCTTRPPREGEVDGKNYYFVSDREFNKKVCNGEMAEWTMFNSWCYGTPISSLAEDKINIGVFNPAGLRSLLRSPQVCLFIVYVDTLDKIRLIRQLNREEKPNVHEIIRRFSTDEKDFLDFISDFKPYIVLNNNTSDLDFAVRSITTMMADETFGQKWLQDNV